MKDLWSIKIRHVKTTTLKNAHNLFQDFLRLLIVSQQLKKSSQGHNKDKYKSIHSLKLLKYINR